MFNSVNISSSSLRALIISILKNDELFKISHLEIKKLFSLKKRKDAPIVIVTPNRKSAEVLLEDLRFYLSSYDDLENKEEKIEILPFFSWEVLPFDSLSPSLQISSNRILALNALKSSKNLIIVSSADSFMQKVLSPEYLEASSFYIKVGDNLSRDEIWALLKRNGYVKSSIIEQSGEYSYRGAVVDVFPVSQKKPIRIETFRHNVESIRYLDLKTERSSREVEVEKQLIIPAREIVIPSSLSKLENKSIEEVLESSISKLKKRASELNIPNSKLENLLNSFKEDMSYPGIEHISPIIGNVYSRVWDYFPKNTTIITTDWENLLISLDSYSKLLEEREKISYEKGRIHPKIEDAFNDFKEVKSYLKENSIICFNSFSIEQENKLENETYFNINNILKTNEELKIKLKSSKHLLKPLEPFFSEVRKNQKQNISTLIVSSLKKRNRRIEEICNLYGFECREFSGGFRDWVSFIRESPNKTKFIWLLEGILSEGVWGLKSFGFNIVFERELFPEWSPKKKVLKAKDIRKFIGTLSQLRDGNFIVHADHGVGKYCGLREIKVGDKVGDFLHLEYADNAKLFLPVENIAKVQKFVGVEGKNPKLNRLGTKTWEQTKKKVKKDVTELAGRLVDLYAQRELVKGHSFSKEDTLDLEFADTFAYEPTEDQMQSINDVLKDMSSSKPMDRLVCGDVGYGKTEVALRASFKAVNGAKQVALLVPTTVLAEQHYLSFKERFETFPVTIGFVSRFSTSKENKEVLKKVKEGKIDIIIGTHRLLQKDVSFKDLGLLIIDEEHRFGVSHKEKLKEFRKEVDVLTLTATPIPRTLHMSLLGIRDLSIIETPPSDRQVIRTYLSPYKDETVREGILRELNRGGQVFYVHNRVRNIYSILDELTDLVPEARIDVAHGQMKESDLSRVMHRYLKHEIDVLISTTIIESGIDIPNANTIIIRDAERFGLSQLYQLRGRVGRSTKRAYAYLLVGGKKVISSEAQKRLEVLQSLDDLGVGFRLALQDMEIRGAGNLLGKDQSGPVSSVGFELYSQVLKEAVLEVKKRMNRGLEQEKKRRVFDIEPELYIGFPAHIPNDYMQEVSDRLLIYQRLVNLKDEQEARDIIEEVEDRFGKPPEDFYILVELMVLRALLKKYGVLSIKYSNESLHVLFHEDAGIDINHLMKCVTSSNGDLKISPSMVISYKCGGVKILSPEDIMNCVKELLKILNL